MLPDSPDVGGGDVRYQILDAFRDKQCFEVHQRFRHYGVKHKKQETFLDYNHFFIPCLMAIFLVPTLLVVSHPVSACMAGSTSIKSISIAFTIAWIGVTVLDWLLPAINYISFKSKYLNLSKWWVKETKTSVSGEATATSLNPSNLTIRSTWNRIRSSASSCEHSSNGPAFFLSPVILKHKSSPSSFEPPRKIGVTPSYQAFQFCRRNIYGAEFFTWMKVRFFENSWNFVTTRGPTMVGASRGKFFWFWRS